MELTKTNITFLFCVSTCCLVLVGCTSIQLDTAEELYALIDGPKGRYCDLWQGTFYCGRKAQNHLFLHRLMKLPDRFYTVPADQIAVLGQFEFTGRVSSFIEISGVSSEALIDGPLDVRKPLPLLSLPGNGQPVMLEPSRNAVDQIEDISK